MPKYYLIKGRIIDLVTEAGPGGALPTERELAALFATSRTTVRQALAELVVEGRLERTQGRGTFATEPKRVELRQLSSFSADVEEHGRSATSEIIDVCRRGAEPEVAARLGVEPGTPVHRVERLRGSSAAPIAHEVAYLTPSLPRLAARLRRRGSLYATLSGDYGIDLARAEDLIETSPAGPLESRLLDVDVGLPMLLVHRTAWDVAGRLIEWTRASYRGDRFRFLAHSALPGSARTESTSRHRSGHV